jgi:hypothetical protein
MPMSGTKVGMEPRAGALQRSFRKRLMEAVRHSLLGGSELHDALRKALRTPDDETHSFAITGAGSQTSR